MSQIVTQNPGSSEIQSPLIAGITEGLNKLSAVLNLKTGTLEDVQLTAVSIDNDEKNKNRIFEANFGNRLWLSSPAPVIKKNGSEITQIGSNFTIDYIGGSITFSAESKPSDGDKITVSATYIIAESDALNAINTALSAVQTQSSKYKGNYDNVGALQLAHSSAQNGDYAIVFDPLAVYAWKNDGWYDTRSIEDLSDYYNKGETNNLLGQKEPTIQQKGTSASDDDYYWGGRKTWQDFKEKVRSTVLTGLSTASDAAVSATDTLLVAVGKLQAQVSKATQRAYLTGTGAPSTSTVGAVGQRYVNTSNGDEYTCEEVSGDTYTWRLHTRSVNGKRPETPGGDIKLEAADIGAEVAGTGISTYTCTTSGSVHALSGKGNNIKFVADAPFNDGDTITVNEEPVTAKTQDGEELSGGAWAAGAVVVCYLDGTTLNFKGGGGLSAADRAKLIPENIRSGVTFFEGTPRQVVGNVQALASNQFFAGYYGMWGVVDSINYSPVFCRTEYGYTSNSSIVVNFTGTIQFNSYLSCSARSNSNSGAITVTRSGDTIYSYEALGSGGVVGSRTYFDNRNIRVSVSAGQRLVFSCIGRNDGTVWCYLTRVG